LIKRDSLTKNDNRLLILMPVQTSITVLKNDNITKQFWLPLTYIVWI